MSNPFVEEMTRQQQSINAQRVDELREERGTRREPSPTHAEIRVQKLRLALSKLEQMKPSETRDSLIFDIENLVSRIMHHARGIEARVE